MLEHQPSHHRTRGDKRAAQFAAEMARAQQVTPIDATRFGHPNSFRPPYKPTIIERLSRAVARETIFAVRSLAKRLAPPLEPTKHTLSPEEITLYVAGVDATSLGTTSQEVLRSGERARSVITPRSEPEQYQVSEISSDT